MDFKLKWADYWPYWEFFFSMWPSVVMCFTMGYLIHVWGVGFFVISIFTELLCFGRGTGITCSLLMVFGIFG